MTRPKYAKKERLTISLSRAAADYAEADCARSQAPSMSAYFESLVCEAREHAEMMAREARAVAYYDSLTAPQLEEESNWGRIGASTLSQLED